MSIQARQPLGGYQPSQLVSTVLRAENVQLRVQAIFLAGGRESCVVALPAAGMRGLGFMAGTEVTIAEGPPPVIPLFLRVQNDS